MQDKRSIGIIGSTGSIGGNACQILRSFKELFSVAFFTCNVNLDKLVLQVIEFSPIAVCVSHECYLQAKEALSMQKTKIYCNINDMLQSHQTHVTLHAISGTAGISCVIDAIKNTKILALSNKEAIVSAWDFIKEQSIESKTKIIPVDSEPNSLFRILENINIDRVVKLGITASGGPFFGKKFHNLEHISPKDAIAHPVWNMGIKNSIDSATMANKVLELIEVMQIFEFQAHNIDTYINRQSVIHASVVLRDGGVLSFSSRPDMKTHIGHAIMYPFYTEDAHNVLESCVLEFHEIKQDEFPIFYIGKEVAKSCDSVKYTIFNVANEIAVQEFCNGKIKYIQILSIISKAIEHITVTKPKTIEECHNMIQIIAQIIKERFIG